MQNIKVIESGTYSVFIGDRSLKSFEDYTNKKDYSAAYILADENTAHHCLDIFLAFNSNSTIVSSAPIIKIQPGESNKNIHTVTEIAKELSAHNADRNSLLINLGGGVLCDIGGFAASIYKRGIDFINLPTTLLSQVDASIGGKVGVDLEGMKNFIGVFNDPKAVFILPRFLKTLNKRQINSGYAEILKHGLIADKTYWNKIKKPNVAANLSDVIFRSVEIKNNIVTKDPREQGVRKMLNFGHTIGHALETFYMNKSEQLLHGEAVGIGMICEAFISVEDAGLSREVLREITDCIIAVFGKYKLNGLEIADLIELMKKDKKNIGDKINFTLLDDIGKAKIDRSANSDLIRASINYYREISQE